MADDGTRSLKLFPELDRCVTNYSYPVGTDERDVYEFPNPNGLNVRGTGYLDISGFTAGRKITVRTYVKVDGANYREYDKHQYTVGADEIGPMFDIGASCAFKLTIQEDVAEAGATTVPRRIVVVKWG